MCFQRSCSVNLVVGSARSDWVAHLGCPGEVGNEHGMRRRKEVMVPTLSQMAPRWALADLLLLELSGELSQSDANNHTPLVVAMVWISTS
jgi:hypothetical protein